MSCQVHLCPAVDAFSNEQLPLQLWMCVYTSESMSGQWVHLCVQALGVLCARLSVCLQHVHQWERR